MIKYVYMVFLAILVAVFVGVTISVFYPQPASPTFPTELNYTDKELTPTQLQLERTFDLKQKAWEETMKTYNRNVSIITLITSLVLVTIGTLLASKLGIIADGLVLSGVLTLLYSLGRGFASQNTKYTFAVTSVALVVALVLGYLRFVKTSLQKHETTQDTI